MVAFKASDKASGRGRDGDSCLLGGWVDVMAGEDTRGWSRAGCSMELWGGSWGRSVGSRLGTIKHWGRFYIRFILTFIKHCFRMCRGRYVRVVWFGHFLSGGHLPATLRCEGGCIDTVLYWGFYKNMVNPSRAPTQPEGSELPTFSYGGEGIPRVLKQYRFSPYGYILYVK